MPRPYKPTIPNTIGEIIDHLAWMLGRAPTFNDPFFDVAFPGRDIAMAFFELREGLGRIRQKLGEHRYQALIELSDRMRAHFEADPEDTNGRTREGRKLIHEMEDILTRRRR
jgi:hypothetical protein